LSLRKNLWERVSQIGLQARTAICLISHRKKWLTVDEIMKKTKLSLTSVTRALNFLVKNFPNLFETDGRRYRYKGLFGEEKEG